MASSLAFEIARNLAGGWGAGLLIGLERSWNGRAAGFRTHALVGLAATATATIALYPIASGAPMLDPTRLAQGVVTGIGFLGAGVIFKEGSSVQGLTTAASIWATAAAGLLFGVGMPGAAVGVTALVLVTLVVFRWVEDVIPWRVYALATFRFEAALAPDEAQLAQLLDNHEISLRDVSYRLTEEGRIFEYSTSLHTSHRRAYGHLAERLKTIPGLVEYDVARISK